MTYLEILATVTFLLPLSNVRKQTLLNSPFALNIPENIKLGRIILTLKSSSLMNLGSIPSLILGCLLEPNYELYFCEKKLCSSRAVISVYFNAIYRSVTWTKVSMPVNNCTCTFNFCFLTKSYMVLATFRP